MDDTNSLPSNAVATAGPRDVLSLEEAERAFRSDGDPGLRAFRQLLRGMNYLPEHPDRPGAPWVVAFCSAIRLRCEALGRGVRPRATLEAKLAKWVADWIEVLGGGQGGLDTLNDLTFELYWNTRADVPASGSFVARRSFPETVDELIEAIEDDAAMLFGDGPERLVVLRERRQSVEHSSPAISDDGPEPLSCAELRGLLNAAGFKNGRGKEWTEAALRRRVDRAVKAAKAAGAVARDPRLRLLDAALVEAKMVGGYWFRPAPIEDFARHATAQRRALVSATDEVLDALEGYRTLR